MVTSEPGVILNKVIQKKETFCLHADGVFQPGIHLLTGKVGSGKTSLGEILAGIQSPDTGTISWTGKRRVMLLQDTSYHVSTMTVREEAASWHGEENKIIHLAGLTGKEGSDLLGLSRGELKRLELAAILTGGYDLIILDEPYAGLDSGARKWVSQLITDCVHQIIILISHDITSLPRVDILWEMSEGTLSCLGHLPDGLKRWKRPPPLIRYLFENGIYPKGLAREDLEEALCRIPG